MSDKTYIDVLLVKPMMKPEVVRIEDSLEAMQELVGGYIETYMPFEEEVAIVCNEEGKLRGAMPNRGIYDKEGNLQDVIAGDFFICYAPIESESFLSLSEEQIKEYTEKFKNPEKFYRGDHGNIVGKVITNEVMEMER